MKILTVVGARPQFIKAAVVSRAIKRVQQTRPSKKIVEVIVHTGQHYDPNMSQVFFDELDIPKPDYNLEVGSGSHAFQTGEMLEKIEATLLKEKPDWVLIYGDTNSTLAGAIAASKIHIPVAHVEAGLRSFNRRMPEEINRVVADHLSTVLFCPTETAVKNLKAEGIPHANQPQVKVVKTGDVMFDAACFYQKKSAKRPILKALNLKPKGFILATIHRAENTETLDHLLPLLKALDKIGQEFFPVIWPIHPRTRHLMQTEKTLRKEWLETKKKYLQLVEPLGYLDMVCLEQNANLIVTDSGGVQKEAFFHKVPCLTLRPETEWVELVKAGWNFIAGGNPQNIFKTVKQVLALKWTGKSHPELYGKGKAGQEIVSWFLT